jgi:hypothetical protein
MHPIVTENSVVEEIGLTREPEIIDVDSAKAMSRACQRYTHFVC